ncbi:MAG: sugar ABC transporter substrate-binding protein [Ardenticatenaceae bacterium]|nr:sugar ABC transporter substrate-binding protein [Ardenticatenaceae bacterium]
MSWQDGDKPLNKISRRKFLSTSLQVGLGMIGVSALNACAPAATPGASQSAAPATSAPAVPTTAASKGPVTLEFWQIAQGANYDKVLRQLIEEYEDSHPNVKVNLTVQPQKDMDTKVRSVYTSGGPGPDLMICGSVYSLTYARMPYGFIDLTDRIAAEKLKDTIAPSAWETMQENDKQFGVPFTAFLFLLNYNKDLYKAAGLSGPPTTLDELLANSKKITDPSQDRYGFLAFTAFPAWILEQLWYDAGVGYFEGSENFDKYDVTKPITITKPEAVAALEYVKSLAETAPGGLQGNIGVKTGDADAAFAKGNLAHFYTHTIHTSQIQSYNENMVPQKNFDVAAFPKGPKRQGVMFSTEVAGISKGSKDPDAAWDFLKFLSDLEGRIAPSSGTVPLRGDVDVDQNQAGSWLVPIGRQLLQGEVFPQAYFPQQGAFASSLTSNVEAYFLDKKSAEQALSDVATEAAKSLKQ